MTARELESLLLVDGWYHKATKGSHEHFKHPTKPSKITIPQHKGDIDKGTVKSILEQAGLK